MKKEILDSPFRDSFEDFLSKDEKILWEEFPSTLEEENDFQGFKANAFWWFVGILGIIILKNTTGIIFIIFMSVAIIGRLIANQKNKNKPTVHYAITPKQILFKFSEEKKTTCHSLHFSEIKKVKVLHTKHQKRKYGTFFLILHNAENIPFRTRDAQTNTYRHTPTLELIFNPSQVLKLIEKGIRENQKGGE